MDEDAFIDFLVKRGNPLGNALTVASVLSAGYLMKQAEALGDDMSEETAKRVAAHMRKQLAVSLALGDTNALPFEESGVPED